MGGTADADLVARMEEAGVGRVLLFPTSGDLDVLRSQLEPFSRDVISRHSS